MPTSVQGCPVDHARPLVAIPPIEILGTSRSLLNSAPLAYSGSSVLKNTVGKAAERYARKLRWLSKLAGWSGHAALMDCCPEYGAATFSS